MATSEWSVIAAGFSFSERRIERGITGCRRIARRQLLSLVQCLEGEIARQVGVLLPVRYPKRSHAMYDYLPELLAATNGRRYFVRSWAGGRVVLRQRFWGHQATNCGLDEVMDAIGAADAAAPAEGTFGVYDRFVGLVQRNRELRGRGGLYGMIRNGLDPGFAAEIAEGPLDQLLLCGTVEEAAEAVVKELHGLSARYSPFERSARDLDDARQTYFGLVVAGEFDEAFAELLLREDQELASLPGVRLDSWQALAAVKLGIVANEDEAVETLAPVIKLSTLRRLRRSRKRAAVG
ncbi:MAG TPA: hypothetical protein VLF41_02670 [Candidatus Nanoarchaeia archaeon]|nr:hypothetical protein [Candidatus Nanoarchaeia archaeon]